MISKNTIETVFETARVEEVIGDFVQLKRAGTNLKGLSPFSDEKSPSFMVSPVKQIWKDFSSGKGGNAVTFLMEHEHFSYPEAIRYLAKKYNIEIEETEQSTEEVAVANEKESMYLVSEFAQKFFQDKMLHTNEGQAIGLSYFKERGFTLDTIKKFGLGFSPEGWDVFTKEALEKGYKLEFLEKTGLTITKEDGRHFDRFKGRVMFPIQSMSGRVLGFGGRILINDKKVAKYVNSPESEIYHKSKVLYGIYYAKQAIAKQDNCFLCEGYTDVIQMHQAGIENVVASSGTALTPNQIRLINRLTKNVTVLFDGDAAGLRASIRGIDLILEEGMNVKVCTFPDGDDPDSFARKTPHDDLLRYLDENAMDFIQFKASLLMKEAKNDPIKKADLIRDMVISIAKIPDRIKREVYIKECSRIMDISEEVLFNTLAQLVQKDITESNKKLKQEQKAFTVVKNEDQSAKSKIDVQYQLERKIIEILLLYGNAEEEFTDYLYKATPEGELKEIKELNMYKVYQRIYLSLQEDEVELANPLFRAIYNEVMNYYHQNEKFEIEHFLMQLTPELAQEVTSILMEDEKMNLHNWEVKLIYVKLKDQTIGQYVTETILSLRWFLVNKIIEEVKGQLSPDPQADNSEILYMVMDYSKLVGNFSSKLGRVMSRYS
ncbi:DNA primase [Flavobacterium columnare]|uniref:DNA primase n=1 Tax=Flavobacterium columnare TaxID=996 RepID=A0AAI8CIN3_9FLAO|nr:DNA primase [Flavobacterium columnare]AMO20909.1 DNA primase [Flavobacterium columnare]AUX18905.1 DNA primase [Flavobacterium columnare]QOG57987.1 DNA primase [Flavobacterium columnare]QOG60709.1 DNA primase [Flavobacterium columnare]QOG63429.1 DNA primase [Flavobacterium columnare]